MSLEPLPWIANLSPYRPGEPSPNLDGSMASNESPFGVSQAVIRAVERAATSGNRYPDPLANELRKELAVLHGVEVEQVMIGNGSDEIILMLAWAYLGRDRRMVCAEPGYQIDAISARIVGAQVSMVPLRNLTHDLPAMAQVSGDIAYVVNPHNPTGTACSAVELETFSETARTRLIVVDEAYIDFANDPRVASSMPLVKTGKVAVLRTFSKLYGLAGFRIGYLVASADVIETLVRVRAPFSVNRIAQAAALAAIRHRADYVPLREEVIQRRQVITDLFEGAGFQVSESQANFVLVLTPDERAVIEHLRDHLVSVRPGTSLGIPGSIRVSVPTEAGLKMLAGALACRVHQV